MKKVFIGLSVLLLAGVGYFTYVKWVKHANLTSWNFIPADAALVMEGKVMADVSTLKAFPMWSMMEESSGFDNLIAGLHFLDSINGEDGFSVLFEEAPVLTSIHKVSNTKLDFLFVAELENISQNTFANATIGRLKESGYRFRTRNYNDFKISEISNQGKTLTFIFFQNFFLASFTPYLVEDAIRALNDGDRPAFKDQFEALESDKKASSQFTLYANYVRISDLISAFMIDELALPLFYGKYEATIDSSIFQLSGFSYAQPNQWLATHNTAPATFDMAEVIPENTAMLHHISFSEVENWKHLQLDHLRETNQSIRIYQDSLKKSYDFNTDQVFDLLESEIAVATLESQRTREQQRLMVLEVRKMDEAKAFFDQLTERVSIAKGDSVYLEAYSENEIRYLPIQEFPSLLLGEMATGFSQCFYISYRNYLIFANDLQELKNLIASIQEENTWGKSLQMNNFLQRTNNAANVSLFINIPRAWSNLMLALNKDWEDHFKTNAQTYKTLELAAFQFSHVDGKHFTNFSFTQPVKRAKTIPKTSPENGVRFISKLTSKPYLLKTHAHQNFNMILQDSTHTLYYLDPNQNALWTETLDGQLNDHIYVIDFYKNGKLQYLMATSKSVYILDRTGKPIPGYPKQLSGSSSIEQLNLIDYNRSRNYRISVSDSEGNVFLTDKELNPLDGWKPKALTRAALMPMEHARLGRRDIMISVQENGIINVLNRRGQNMPGFPFDTRQSLDGNYSIRRSSSLANSSMTVISTGGELIEINLEGGVIKRDQLIKATADAVFRLIPDNGGESFIIVRNEGNSYEVLDDTGNLLFQKDYLNEGSILIQYYQFGAGKDLVVFTDQGNNTLFIYDKSGNLLTGNPLRSAHEVSLIYSSAKREFQVFTTWDSNLELYTFSY